MSDNSPKKFPYLIIPTAQPSSDKGDGDGVHATRAKDNPKKREARQRSHPRNVAEGTPYSGPGYLPFMEDNLMSHALNANNIAHSTGQAHDFSTLNSISMCQMRAILTAQKELRKPACSLYPPASQISLIPETEMIYRKYFPGDGKENPVVGIPYNRNPVAGGKEKVPNKIENIGDDQTNNEIVSKRTASASISEMNVSSNENLTSGKSGMPPTPVGAVSGLNDKQAASKQRDAEARFKKRVQAQLVSLCAEVERQSTDLNDIRKELKDLLTLSRKNSTDNDSSKSRLDTLSKHVNEIDNKMDTVQESISSQEKNLLGKLMLFGDLSDSESEMDESRHVRGVDASSCPSSTKVGLMSSASRPISASAGSSDHNLPKACCNWVPIAPDFDKLLQAVALLNYRMDRNQSMKLCTTNNGATFKHSDVIDLTIFKNGIVLGSTGFRSYSTMSVIRFINEIFNGYLPTELTTQYPDGVVIVVNDKRSVIHSCDVNFNGSGTKLSVKELPEIIPGRGLNIVQKQESMESIRPSTATSSVSSSLLASSASVTSFAGYRNGIYEMLPDLKGDEAKAKQKKVIILKINERKTGLRFKLRVPINTPLKTLADHLGKVIADRGQSGTTGNAVNGSIASNFKLYDIILPVPHGRLSCADSTLEEYGLIQNTLIYIEEKKS